MKPETKKLLAALAAAAAAVAVVLLVVAVARRRRERFACAGGSRTRELATKETELESYASPVDDQMMSTYAQCRTNFIDAGSSYPLGVYEDSSRTFKMKISRDAAEISFNLVPDAVATVWDWAKAICHLIVWAGALIKLANDGSGYDVKGDAETQLGYLATLQAQLPKMRAFLTAVDGAEPETTTTVNSPVAVGSVDEIIAAATGILGQYSAWCTAIKATGTPTTDIVADSSEAIAWLMQAAIAVVMVRGVNGMQKIQQQVGLDTWGKLRVVQTRRTIDPINDVDKNPRGITKSTSNTAQLFRSVMTEAQFHGQHFIFVTDDTSWDAMELISFESPFMTDLAALMAKGRLSNRLALNCVAPTSTFLHEVTHETGAAAAYASSYSASCDQLASSGSAFACPFAGAAAS